MSNKTNLDSDNIDLWSKFPGRLLTNLSHSFRMFTINQLTNYKTSVDYQNESYVIDEIVDYKDIVFNSKDVFFDKKGWSYF